MTVKRSNRLTAVLIITLAAAGYCGSQNCAPASPATRESQSTTAPSNYEREASEVSDHIQSAYYLAASGMYAHSLTDRHPDFMWGEGVLLTAQIAASRADNDRNLSTGRARFYPIFTKLFAAVDHHWDTHAPIPGYEPLPVKSQGHDKYYDDNAWVAISLLEAYETTHDLRYLTRAHQTLNFVLSGWDDAGGGGIWWHEGRKDDTKNTCSNAPAAVACLRVARYESPEQAKLSIAKAKQIIDWTVKTFECDDGLFADSIVVSTDSRNGHINNARLTYNTALMIRAFLQLYNATHDDAMKQKAIRAANAADWFLDPNTHAYRDPVKWANLQVEADLEIYRATKDEKYLTRATQNADYEYAQWKRNPPTELIDNAAIARTLWLMAETQSAEGRAFWIQMDRPAAQKK